MKIALLAILVLGHGDDDWRLAPDYTSNDFVAGMTVVMPGRWENCPALDTNVFRYDSNRNVVTLNKGWGVATFAPVTDNQYQIGPAVETKIMLKVGETHYIRLSLALFAMAGMLIGGLIGIWTGFLRKPY